MPAETSQTLDRGLLVLETLAGSAGGLTVTELAAKLGVNRTVVYRLVATLEQHTLVRRDARGRLHVGLGVLHLASAVQPVLRDLAGPVLRRLAETVGCTAHLTVAERAQPAALLYRVPAFLHRNQTLSLSTSVAHEEQEAFESDTFAAGAAVERVLGRYLTGSAGLSFERSFITDADGEDDYVLFGFPLNLDWDSTGNALDPTNGVRAHLGVTPYTDFAAEAQQFGMIDGQTSLYLGLDEADRWVVALRAGAGAVVGEPRSGIPPDKRFYAGGGDSVRGYGYQLVGPLEDDATPLGGASILTAGIELRARILEQCGGVVFVDAGNVYEDNVPTGEGDLLVGAGVGLRYYTPIGPLRLDVAVPLDRRPVDDAFQLYISLGQAF